MRADRLDYHLPEELIAQAPTPARDGARLCVLRRGRVGVEHARVRDLPSALPPALWVFNDTRVIPARLHARRASGGRVELLLLEQLSGADEEPGARWRALARPAKRLREGEALQVCARSGEAAALEVRVAREVREGTVELWLRAEGDVSSALARCGELPLPPYIRRPADAEDATRYQTVFARAPGAVAAPTAGLHFSEALLAQLQAAGHTRAFVTLHVGAGTFMPLKADDLRKHAMHTERYQLPAATVQAIARAKAQGRPVVAVGTTVVRTLEAAALRGALAPGPGRTDLCIYPPFRFRVVDALLTNFHLPRSTLLALVMAFGGEEPVRQAYAEAVRERYRFFSYGDAMLIGPDAD